MKNDPTHVQHIVAWLNQNPPPKGKSKSEIIDHLIGLSSTYTRGEAQAAYARWKGGGHGMSKKRQRRQNRRALNHLLHNHHGLNH